MSSEEVRELISRILASDRMKASSHFSDAVYADEPILTTGSRMAGYLPERYRQMRAISRYQEGGAGGRGRWLSEAELFARQGAFMADWDDDCPYRGTFRCATPTYNAMSDRQLRGYFTWRAAVRAGGLPPSSSTTTFSQVYLTELLCGIGTEGPADGLARMQALLAALPDDEAPLKALAEGWLLDFCAWHGLDPAPLAGMGALERDGHLLRLARALGACRDALAPWAPRRLVPWTEPAADRCGAAGDAGRDDVAKDGARPASRHIPTRARRALKPGVPVLADTLEEELLSALDALSSYKVMAGEAYRERPRAMRHVACAVFLRLADHYDANRKQGLLESFLGARAELPYAMFSTALFWSEGRHADADWEANPLRRYRCRRGMWTCERVFGETGPSTKLGDVLRAAERGLVRAPGGAAGEGSAPDAPGTRMPKYLEKIVAEEVAAWTAWEADRQRREVTVDLSRLAGIRRAAAATREALLIDEEREDGPRDMGDRSRCHATRPAPAPALERIPAPPADGADTCPLTREQVAFLRALLSGEPPAAANVDLMADEVNDALLDLLGDTAVEFGAAGPRIVEDYRDEIERIVNDAS